MTGGVAVLVPVLRRPHRVVPLLESIEAATPELHRVLFLASPGDDSEQDAVRASGADLVVIDEPPGAGDYARKINAGIRATVEPVLLMAADDLCFHPGWLTAALRRITGTVGVVGTNDLHNRRVTRGSHATHLLFTRRYVEQHGTIDEPGKLLHEGYHHNFVDDEAVQTAKHRAAWAFAVDSHVEHLHPNYGGAPRDEVYDLAQAQFERDRRYYQRRCALWT